MSGLRLFVVGLGILALLLGLLALTSGPLGAGGIWLIVAGSIVLLAVAFERTRYRSEAAERQSVPPGPGGGEALDAPLEPRFSRTEEVFVDPTSQRVMRVFIDRRTGERRYRAEG
jgi:uncharacterized membrane protein YedE/YeeE